MARFRGTLAGGRGMVSRLGTPKSGLSARVNGWEAGVRVYAHVDEAGNDSFDVDVTGGSNHRINSKSILTITTNKDGIRVIFPDDTTKSYLYNLG